MNGMRIVKLLIFVTLLYSCRQENNRKWLDSDVGKHQLNGQVKTLKETTYSVSETGEKIAATFITNASFDSAGNFIENSMDLDFDPGTVPAKHERETYQYNALGKLVETERTKGDAVEKRIRIYGESGRLIGRNDFVNGKLNEMHKYTCCGDNRILVDSTFNSHDSLRHVEHIEYTGAGEVVREYYVDPSGATTRDVAYTLDEKGNRIQESTADLSRQYFSRYEYEYYDNGREAEHTLYVKGHKVYKVRMMYERSDALGNWLVKKEYTDGKLSGITERVISYW